MADPYAIDARFYDAWNRGSDADSGLWLSYAGRTDRPVLEVGAGTGRIAIALALHGHEVVAVDPSAAMLAIARQQAEERGLDVRFVEGRLTDLALEADHYGLAVVGADVFLHCEDGEEQIATLRALCGAVAFDGLVAIDLPGPAVGLDASTNGHPLLAWSGAVEGGLLDVWQVHEDDLALQTRTLRVTYELTGEDGGVRRQVSVHRLRYPGRFEMEYLLHLAGLAQVDIFGDYDLGPLTSECERMIVVARRAGA